MTYLFLLLSYLLGATPTSYWAGKASRGIDLRDHGSGNLGATNTLRILGWRWAVPVVTVDVLKGFVPVWFFPSLAGGAGLGWTLLFGTAAIMGHMFSFWVQFRGGKGVATSAGVFLGLAPLAVLASFGVWFVVAFGTRYVSMGSMSAALSLPVFVAFFQPESRTNGLLAFTLGLAAFVVWKHRSNIQRLLAGEENRFGAEDEGAADGGGDEPARGGPGGAP